MFQSFDETADFSQSASRLARLRAALTDAGVDGFLVPRADEHQGEYIPDSAARLAWLTGFSGSAGMAVVLRDRAALLVDGRYTLQVRSQIDTGAVEPVSTVETSLEAFLAEAAPGASIGYDPWLHTSGEVARLEKALAATGGRLVALAHNPVDRIWNDRPAPPQGRAALHPEALAGESAAAKLERMRAAMAKADVAATVLTDPSSIAWTFNLRGSDVPHTPLMLAFAILPREGRPVLFVDGAKLDAETRAALAPLAEIEAPDGLEAALRRRARGGRIGLDPALAARRLFDLVEQAGGTAVEFADPARLPRAVKNAAELDGARAAHRRDGAAVCAFLAWLDGQEPGTLTEIGAAKALEAARAERGRKEGMDLLDISFDTIAGSGPNGAIVHYRVNENSDRTLRAGELFLLDSGAQYRDGTTDITRTVPIGPVGADERRMFTLVLKGMIAISTARFPKGTRGLDLDPLARIALWKAGVNYAHGTGHGVGSYLAVHEGPQSLSPRGAAVLLPGMILSNEPGYYREGEFGIRIENLVVVEEARPIEGGDLPMHAFETLTLVPVDRRLVEVGLLTPEERDWLDAYHARVRAEIAPLLDERARAWLEEKTAPLAP
ncbi:aminopeptidase P family protein [Aurantimonas sp. Leaf443]|uniref:aminopeptidase P family protein n=1 Tax=Aurantimonas sp. Leaf443 TaxID=1736378 RepID=UPI0006F8E5F3|nr:aminopeptidase P family protein [Aurantimonas sp. Leaf443]KQT86065.1 X-Pro aminopeptidase [Aurantimonas sp. Leaf443]